MNNLQNHFKQHILRNHFLHIGLGVLFGIAMVIRLLSSSAQVADPFFPFNSFIAKHNNTSSLFFQYGGNSFTGVIARSGWMDLSTPQVISLSGSSLSGVSCYKQIEGMYYNPVRGSKLWPLDVNTLQQLKGLDASYQGMLVDGGLYTECVGSGVSSNYVLGQVTVNYAGSKYTIIAGLSYDLVANTLSATQTNFGGTITFQNNKFSGKLFDVYGGGIADVSNQTLPSNMTFGGFTGAVFFPGISSVLNAEPKKLYQSNAFSVVGLTGKTQVTISSGALLYINGALVGTSALIGNNEDIKIEMFASENYDESVSSTITVGSLTGLFSITTKSKLPEMCALTKDDKEKVQSTFSGLLIQYNTTSKLTTLLTTMKSMINDMQDFNYDCNVAYLKVLIEEYLDAIESGTTNTHIAPNCKKYTIIYSNTGEKVGYSSSNLRIKQYFANRQSLIKFIDSKNPGDCNVVNYDNLDDDYMDLDDSKYIAPNGKVYAIEETSSGKYTSSTFTTNKKEFSSRESLLAYIDKNNPDFEVWDHTVDTSRAPVTYVAANNKEYKIYKTNKGFMSYKLVKIQYFSSKEEIISYINSHNKR